MNERDVFINCPFSDDYAHFFNAFVYTVVRSGFTPRCARESDDAGEVRYEKICNIIRDCRLGIHDLSMTEIDGVTRLPRFNMPFELGLFLGASKFGGRQSRRQTLILDRAQFRYRDFLSDIAGQDVRQHGGVPSRAIECVAAWLRDKSNDPNIPGGRAIADEFARFFGALPRIAAAKHLEMDELTFRDFWSAAAEWIAAEFPAA